MRIIYYHQYFSTPTGFTGTRSYEMSRRLISRGHTVIMVCGTYAMSRSGLTAAFRKGIRRGVVDGITIVEFKIGSSNYQGIFQRGVGLVKYFWRSTLFSLKEQADISFATSTPLTVGIPAILSRLIRNRPYIFEARDRHPDAPRAIGALTNPFIYYAMKILEKISYRFAEWCIGLAPGIVEGIAGEGISRQKISMIPNGCDNEFFKPNSRSYRALFDLPQKSFIALFAGAHGISNGILAILEAARVLNSSPEHNDILILLVGDGVNKPVLIRQAREMNLTNCKFHDPVPKKDLVKLMNSVNLGLQTLVNIEEMYNGTSPNKFFDYIASGLPVLLNYPGWLSELVKKHHCGCAVAPDNPEEFAQALISLKNNPKETQTMGKRARQLALEKFDRNKLADEFCSLIEHAVQSSSPHTRHERISV